MTASGGGRPSWSSLPAGLRTAVESVLGAPVVSAVSQPGGFSPGSADRVVLADGRRAFVKTVDGAVHPTSAAMHRAEAQIAAVLPQAVPAPRFLGVTDENDAAALCFADVGGRHPDLPWRDADISAALDLLSVVARSPVDATALPHPPADVDLADDVAGFDRLAVHPPDDLNPVAATHLADLRALARRAAAVCRGTALCHQDVRADNLLIGADGAWVLVDWPWATTGAPWIDSAAFLVDVGLYGGHDLESWVARSDVLAAVPPADLTAFLAGLAAMFCERGHTAPPPGMPTLRRFQRDQADVVVAWLAQRLQW